MTFSTLWIAFGNMSTQVVRQRVSRTGTMKILYYTPCWLSTKVFGGLIVKGGTSALPTTGGVMATIFADNLFRRNITSVEGMQTTNRDLSNVWYYISPILAIAGETVSIAANGINKANNSGNKLIKCRCELSHSSARACRYVQRILSSETRQQAGRSLYCFFSNPM